VPELLQLCKRLLHIAELCLLPLNLIEQHRREFLIADTLNFPLLVTDDELGIDLRNLFSDEAVLYARLRV